jgi:regulator of protease activity HflC (stomatin/prohibitin superfamily)
MKNIFFTTVGIIVFIMVFALAMGSFTIVNSGFKGLKFTMGELDDVELEEGLHFKLPFVQNIKEVTIQPIEQQINIPVGEDGAITKDNQTIGTTITLFYRYKNGKLAQLYREYGLTQIELITKKGIEESFKKTIGTYTIFEIASRQQEIISKLVETIRADSEKYPIDVTDIKVTNFDWSDAFDKQIEETMKRAQEVKQKEQELLITEQEANKKIKVAEATKNALITEAQGKYESTKILAEAKVLEGEGIRKYNESIAKNLNVEIKLKELEIKKIEKNKWNGQYVPLYWYAPIPVQTKNNFVGGE